MASDTDSTSSEDPDLQLKWSGRWTLSHRILALNLITVLLVALSTLYLDVFRNRLSKERVRQTRIEATATAQAILAAGIAPRRLDEFAQRDRGAAGLVGQPVPVTRQQGDFARDHPQLWPPRTTRQRRSETFDP